jgi:hypothetical protein
MTGRFVVLTALTKVASEMRRRVLWLKFSNSSEKPTACFLRVEA